MKNIQQQWVKVTRPDGVIQYATRYTRDNKTFYLINGYGFEYTSLEGEITAIEEVPTNLCKALVGFEGDTPFLSVIDRNRYWNGWLCPYIHHSSIPELLKQLNATLMTLEGKLYFVYDPEQEYEPEELYVFVYENEIYYDFTGFGFCFTEEEVTITSLIDDLDKEYHELWKKFIDRHIVTSDVSPENSELFSQSMQLFAQALFNEYTIVNKP